MFDIFKHILLFRGDIILQQHHEGFVILMSSLPTPHAVINTAMMPAKMVIGFLYAAVKG